MEVPEQDPEVPHWPPEGLESSALGFKAMVPGQAVKGRLFKDRGSAWQQLLGPWGGSPVASPERGEMASGAKTLLRSGHGGRWPAESTSVLGRPCS